jgi:hypothetical protein
MRTALDRFLVCQGVLLAVVLSSTGCFSSVKQKDAGATKGDTSAPETAGVDAFSGSGGKVVSGTGGAGGVLGIDARGTSGSGALDASNTGGSGTGGMLGTGGSPSAGGSPGSDGALADAFTPDAPITVDGPSGFDNGATCTSGPQCTSTHCVDGFCCDGACDGQCESCKEAGSAGRCKAVKGAPVGPRTACTGAGTCKGQCDGNNGMACTFDSATVCASQSCSGGVRLSKSICDGKGACPNQSQTTCATSKCTADGTDCAVCTDEPSATTCAGGHCGPTVNNCGNTVQCPTTCSGIGQSCGGGGTPNMCGCADTTACAGRCGTLTNKCGSSVQCSTTCPGVGASCGGGGTPNVCGCTSNPSSVCTGRVCGSVNDQCGTPVSCGTCPTGRSCTAGGACLCSTGTVDCGATGCINVNGNDPNHCGSCANVCGSDRTCQSGNCVCTGYTFPSTCGGCGSWSFDGGTKEGWSSNDYSTQWISSPVQNGTGALALQVTGGLSSGSALVSLCTTGAAVDVSNLTMTAYINLSTGGLGSLSALFFDANGVAVGSPVAWGDTLNSHAGQYWPYPFTFPAGTQASWIDIRLSPSPASWAGTIYIDNVQITP